jgi:PQQ-dependent dehydrogenase (methanol/ethanol family)
MRRLAAGLAAVFGIVLVVALVLSLRGHHQPALVDYGPGSANKALPPTAASPPDDGTWTMPSKDYASTRFSGLNQITPANVGKLQVFSTFSTGTTEGFEAPPLVVNNTMYVTAPWPQNVFALDLTKPGSPTKWVYQPNPAAASKGEACCGPVNRGAVFADGKLFMNLLDGNTVAIDANSGKEVWRTKVADYQKGETITMTPLVAAGKVLVGMSGGEMGARGRLTALDEGSGSVAWIGYTTGPDTDVLIGPDYHPPYAQDAGKDLGVKTWPAGMWQHGGGTVWGWLSYDPELKLVYYGTSNPGPWNAEQRPGDNKFTAGVFARDIDTGHVKWFYQSTPHDLFDHDDINEIILADVPAPNGQRIPALLRPDRNGYFYVQDRRNGKILSVAPYSYINAYKGVDIKTGRIIPNTAMDPKVGRVVRGICPGPPGAKDWNPSAYSPVTGLLYIPHLNICMDMGIQNANYIPGTPFVGADVKMYAGPGGNRGVFTAWDPVRNRKAFEIKEDLPLWSPALATAGNLVFYGTMDGWFKAIDARNGKLLWQFKTDSGIIGQPISYRGPDGRQYIAVASGVGGWAGAIVSADLDPDDPTAALGFVNATKDLKKRSTPGGTVYVFALPQ